MMIDLSLILLFGRREATYSYNWPYDYFSLVEFAKVELSLDYVNNEVIEKIVQASPATVGRIATSPTQTATPAKKKPKGKKGI